MNIGNLPSGKAITKDDWNKRCHVLAFILSLGFWLFYFNFSLDDHVASNLKCDIPNNSRWIK